MIKFENVRFSVNDEKSAEEKIILNNVNLEISDSSITAITGHNGGGKSTLVKLLMGMEKPTSGKIYYNNEDITSLGVTERARLGFSVAFQQPVRFKGITVGKLLELASGKKRMVGELCEYLSAVGLCAKDYVNREVDATLSGGELKRIELATALAKGGEVFILDEPEAGIDLWSFEELIKTFLSLSSKTVIIVTHQKKILEIADTIVLLNHGAEPETGSREKMLPVLAASDEVCGRLRRS